MKTLRVEYHVFHLGFARGVHCHPHHELLLVEAGSFATRCGGRRYQVDAGGVVWYAAGVKHQPNFSRTQANTSAWYVAWEGDPIPTPTSGVMIDHATRLRPAISWLYDLWSEGRPEAEDLLRVVCAELGRHEHSTTTKTDPVERLRRYIYQHRNVLLTLDQLTTFMGTSSRTLQRQFKATFHCTPMAYYQRCRAESAASLLTETNLSVAAIAERINLSDGSALGRLIRQHYKCSPTALRAGRQRNLNS